MAKGETPKLKLNNRSLWMSADEYAGGSFFYSEWIDSYSNTKSFKLWHYITDVELNKRITGYPVAMHFVADLDEEWYNSVGMVWFTSDWYIESDWKYRGSSTNDVYGWAIYKRDAWTYLNGFLYWDQLLGITVDKIDRITTTTGLWWTNLVENPWITSDTSRTVWTWWTTWANWATHTTWVSNLRQLLTLTNAWKYRITAKVSWVTVWSCEVRLWTDSIWTITSNTDNWFMGVWVAWSTSEYLNFIPSTDFNWTIEYATAQEYDNAKLLPDNISITQATRHPVCMWQWSLYIWSWATLDVVDLSTFTVDSYSIIDNTYLIKDITQQWGSLIIWASDWINSKQYYWNGVDSAATEVIDRPWNNIVWAVVDETKAYVSTSNNRDKRMYVVSWYQRQLIASNVFNGRTAERWREPYNPNKRFNFYINGVNQMALLNDKLYVKSYGWTYVYWTNVLWVQKWRSKPIKTLTNTYTYCYQTMYWRMYMSNRKDSKNYISYIEEYHYNPTGYLVTTALFWDDISSKKMLNKLKLWYKNIKSTYGNIKVYAIVDDDYFRRYQVTNITTRPIVWDTYNIWTNTTWEVIAVEDNGTTWVITFKTLTNTSNYPWNALSTLTKITWTWQASISTWTLFDNMCLVKTITSDTQLYWDDIIFWDNFIDIHMPYRRKLQLVIELNSNDYKISPEVFDISVLSDVVDNNV